MWVDLYVTNFGANLLLRNKGDGTFRDVTRAVGVDDRRWSTSAAFFDYDRDGWLDLYVSHYVKFDISDNRECFAASSARDYCGPNAYAPEPDRLFHNRRDGTFEDVTSKALASGEPGAGLGVVSADFNGDGWIDLYVANDGTANQLWINQRNGTFRNEALIAGVALNWTGQAEASMGVDAGDFDNDGDEDLFMTHLMEETNTLYTNDGTGMFEDRTLQLGLGGPSLAYTAFGAAWFDYDNDGWMDLLSLNGAVRMLGALSRDGDPYPLDQPNQIFRNLGGAKFEEVSAQGGHAFRLSEVSRGGAFGDVDNDGDTDVLVFNNAGRVRLLENLVGNRNHWLGLRLVDGLSGRDTLGARVEVVLEEGRSLWRRARSDGSYCSANDPRVLVGLGDSERIELVRVYWPSGTVETWTGPPVDRYSTLRKGEGDRK